MILSLVGLASVGCGRETESVQTLLEKAAVLNDRERYDEALAILATALESDRGNSDVHYLRGVAYENLQQFESALDAYNECLKYEPDHTDAFNNRGVIHGRMGNLNRAVSDLTRAIELNPDDALAWTNLGLAYHEIGDLDSAIKNYSEAANRSRNPQILYQRGNSHLAAKRFQEAINDYSAAIENDSNYSRAYLNRAIAHLRSGDYLSASADLDLAEKSDSDMSTTPLVHNLRESLERRTARSEALNVVREWLEQSGWEVNTNDNCPVDFAASRLPTPIDLSTPAPEQANTRTIPNDFFAVVLVKDEDAGVVSNYQLIQSAMSLAKQRESSGHSSANALCLFVVDMNQLDNQSADSSTDEPSWIYYADYDWRPTVNDFETSQVRLKLPKEGQLAPGR